RAGKHIYVEKPLADTSEEMKNILRVVQETGVKTQVGHNRRAAPAVRHALRVLEKHRANPISPPWRWNREGKDRPTLPGERSTMVLLRVNDDYWSWKKWAFAHGALINEMTHFADLACCFIPEPPVRVTTTGSRMANHVVTMEFADGSLATIFATAFGSFGYPKELIEIYHNGAAVVIDHLMEVRVAGVVGEPFRTVFPFATCTDGSGKQLKGPLHSGRGSSLTAGIEAYYRRVEAAQRMAIACGDNSILPEQPDKGHYALLDDWVQCIKNGGEPICNVAVAAVPTAIILRALESEKCGGTPVTISPEDY
ncbi:MAG: Gfo/Idh/MocA family protein, partial [Armatimonadota bacterium]